MKKYLYITLLAFTGVLITSCGETESCGCNEFGLLSASNEQTIFFPGAFTPDGDGKNDFASLRYTGTEPSNVRVLIKYNDVTIDSVFGSAASWNGEVEGLNVGNRADFRVFLYYTNPGGENILRTFRLKRLIPSSCGLTQEDKELSFSDMYVPGSAELGQTSESFCQ